MLPSRCSDDERVDVLILQEFVERTSRDAPLMTGRFRRDGISVADCSQGTEFREIPDEVQSPASAADNSNTWGAASS